jgi:hypothetical protein
MFGEELLVFHTLMQLQQPRNTMPENQIVTILPQSSISTHISILWLVRWIINLINSCYFTTLNFPFNNGNINGMFGRNLRLKSFLCLLVFIIYLTGKIIEEEKNQN